MKKLIFKITALMMCVMIFACPVFADNTDTVGTADALGSEYDENIETLSALGILDWDIDTFSLSGDVSRGDFTRLVTNVVSNGQYSSDISVGVFSDVGFDTELGKVLYTAKSYGIVSGDGSSSFYPDRAVTYEEAYKILACALGYDEYAKSAGGYPTGYVMACIAAGLKSDSVSALSDKLTPSSAAKLIVDAFECDVMKVVLTDGKTGYEIDRNEKWLYASKKIISDEGVVTANSATKLTSYGDIDKGFVSIDKVRYKCDKSFDAFLGYNVKYYYTEENGNCDKILHMTKQYNGELIIDANDIADGTLSDRKIEYYTDGGKTKRVKIPIGASVIKNGRAKLSYSDDVFDIDYGFIKLVDNDADGEYEVVFLNEYKNMIVGAVNTTDKTAADKYNGTTLDFTPYENEKVIHVYDESGKESEFKNIAEKDVLSYALSDDEKILTVYISKSTIEGKVDSSTQIRDKKYFGINGSETALASDASFDTSSIRINAEGIAYLNAFGEITDFVLKNEADNLMYVIEAYIDTERASHTLNLRVLTSNGEIKTYVSVKNLLLNGTRYKDIIDGDNIPKVIENGGLMLIEINDEGLVRKIDTPDSEGSTLHSFGQVSELSYWSSNKTFGGKWFAEAGAKVFVTPKDNISADDDFYRVLTMNEFQSDVKYTIAGYTVGDDAYYAKAIVLKTDDKVVVTGKEAFVVKSVTKTVNGKDEIVNMIEVGGYSTGERKYATKDETVLADAKPGDIVLLNIVNSVIDKGEVVLYAKTLTFNPDSEFVKRWNSGLTFMAGSNYKFGNVLFRNNTLISIVDDAGIDSAAGKTRKDYAYSDFEYTDIASSVVFTVDRTARDKNSMVYKSDKNAVKDYLTFGETSKVYIYTRSGYPRLTVVYK